MTKRLRCRVITVAAGIAITGFLLGLSQAARTQQVAAETVRIDERAIGGTVSGEQGSEAGVWVIAETTQLPTKFAKIVVTDDRGRYVIPDLPAATYDVWVRGYGLVDSAKVKSASGKIVDLKATQAPNAKSAAQYYPALYWYAMLAVPPASDFPGTGTKGNGMPETLKSQGQWLDIVKTDGCFTCHALGNAATRTIEPQLGKFANSAETWEARIQSGQAATNMVNNIGRLDTQRALKLFADWTDRIAAGALPPAAPQRPQGVERNLVVTLWDWSDPKAYLHDSISTDRRDPTRNPNGPLYGATEESTQDLPVLDPVKNTATTIHIPVRDANTPSAADLQVLHASPYWGDEKIWNSQASVHNPMLDKEGRVWFTARIRGEDTPAFCKKGSDHSSAKLFPVEKSTRQLAMYDPKTKKFTLIDTCFTTHHLQFASDADDTLWTSAGGPQNPVVGWLNTKKFLATGDAAASQGWAPLILDTNGNGKRDDWVEPKEVADPAKDKRIVAGLYGVAVSPTDGTVWGTTLGFPGAVVHLIPGGNPPETALAEYFEVPWDDPKAPVKGFSPRGMDIDKQGVVWMPLASGHFASFDRKKCEGPLNGPQATGKQCPEGWTLYSFPGPKLQNDAGSGSAEASYYAWVDQFNTLGLGADVPIATGNGAEGLLALVAGKFVTLRVPYPLGFYIKGMDGRIDDPAAGWKGRGIWTTTGSRTPFHMEGGKGTRPKVYHFQLRPDPLAF
jgi:hypothetical protein